MPFDFQCQNCRRLLRAPDGSGGKQCQCPECGKMTLIIESNSLDLPKSNSPLKTPCPKCNRNLEYTESLIGTRGLCKNCQFIFTLPSPGERPRQPVEAGTFPFSCPKCHQLFEGRNEMEGRKGKCHRCQAMFVIRRNKEVVKSELILDDPPARIVEPPAQRLGNVVDFQSDDALAAGMNLEPQLNIDSPATTNAANDIANSKIGLADGSRSIDRVTTPGSVVNENVVAEIIESPKATIDEKFDFSCSTCSTLLRASISHVGKSIRCPNCRVVMEIPQFQSEDAEEFLDLQVEVIQEHEQAPQVMPAPQVSMRNAPRLPISFVVQQVEDYGQDDQSWRSLPRVNRTTSRAISPLKTAPLLGGSNHVKLGPIQPVTPSEVFRYVATVYPSTFFYYWLPLGLQVSILIAILMFGSIITLWLTSALDSFYGMIAGQTLMAIPLLVCSILLAASVCRFTSHLVSSGEPSLRHLIPSSGQVGATSLFVLLGVAVMVAAHLSVTSLVAILPESLRGFSQAIAFITGLAPALPILLGLTLVCIAIGSGESIAMATRYSSEVVRSSLACLAAIFGLSFLLMACMVLVLCLLILLLPLQYVVLIGIALLSMAIAVAVPLILQLLGSLYFLARNSEVQVV